MRRYTIVLLSLSCLAGCGGRQIDDTTGRALPVGEHDDYVPGPYGYGPQSTIENLQFLAKWDPEGLNGTARYQDLPLQRLSLADVRRDPAVRYLVIIGAGAWCPPCSTAAHELPQVAARYEPKGFRFIETLDRGYYDKGSHTGPATEAVLDKWATDHNLHSMVALDPESRFHQIANETSWPFEAIVRASDMKIMFTCAGDGMAPELARLADL